MLLLRISKLHTSPDARLQIALPMAWSEVVQQLHPCRLHGANTVQKQQMGRICEAVYSFELDLFDDAAKLLTESALAYWPHLGEVRNGSAIRTMRLLAH